MPTHVFVDESKARHLVLAATVVATDDLAAVRAALRRLLLPGQRRLHFHNEQSARRSRILTTLLGLPVSVRVYETAGVTAQARSGCLRALAADLDALDARRLVLEVDEVFRDDDTVILTAATRRLRARGEFTFDLVPPAAEPLLWVSDAVAWCHARGGHWRRRAAPLIVTRKGARP